MRSLFTAWLPSGVRLTTLFRECRGRRFRDSHRPVSLPTRLRLEASPMSQRSLRFHQPDNIGRSKTGCIFSYRRLFGPNQSPEPTPTLPLGLARGRIGLGVVHHWALAELIATTASRIARPSRAAATQPRGFSTNPYSPRRAKRPHALAIAISAGSQSSEPIIAPPSRSIISTNSDSVFIVS